MKSCTRLLSIFMLLTLLSGFIPLDALVYRAQAAEEGRRSLAVSKTMTAPVIDGMLDESVWTIDQPLNARVGEGSFKEARFGLLWDNKYVYIGVKADDDSLIHNGAGYWFDQDNINIFFDPTRHQSAPFAANDMQLGFVYQPGTTTPEFHFGAALDNHKGKDEKKVLRAIQKTSTGWTLETAVPWDMLQFDPVLTKELGIEIGLTDRYDTDAAKQRSSFWSAYHTNSFWNDTSGYGTVTLVDEQPVAGNVSPLLLQENFDGYQTGDTPSGWISDVNAGSNPFTVVKDTYGNGRLTFDGNASGKQSRIVAPVQWDNYVIEADVRFESFLNTGRWASIMFRAPSNGKVPYNQMAIKQNGTVEIAYRKPDSNWLTPISGMGKPLELNKEYTMKVRVVDNHVTDYLKAKNDPDFTQYGDKYVTADMLMEKGKVGFQADQSKVSFDNLKVTRITADRLDLTIPRTAQALTGPLSVTASVYYSDGVTEAVYADRLKLYSSDDSVVRIVNNRIYPVKQGEATIKTVYDNLEVSRPLTVTASETGAKAVTLTHEQGYVLAVAGEALDLSAITVQAAYSDFTEGPLKGDGLAWSSGSSDIAISNGTVKPLKKGVYPVTAKKDDASVSLQLVVKDPGDAEYVLYEESFDTVPEGTMPEGWTRKEGTTASAAAVKSGAFEIRAAASPDNPSRVLLPDYLGLFGNYKIEADVTHVAANDAARWHSIMYRIQNNDYPYYQMAVRKDATAVNGIEFAERTAANAWNVMEKGSFSEPIDAGKLYHYTVKAYGSRVQQWIDDKLIVNTDAATAYTKGRIGLQANGSVMKVDNIRVTLQQDALPPMPADQFVKVAQPETGIALAPSVVTELTSMNDLAKWSESALPATVVLHVADGLTVTDPSGQTEMGNLESVLGAIGNRMIPAFYVKDEQTVEQLVAFLTDKQLEDAFVISDKGELVRKARTAYPMLRGIVDFSPAGPLSENDLLDIRRQTTANLAKIALLPQSAASRDNVSYLQQRLVMVWTKETASQPEKSLAMHRLITAGVDGILTDSPSTAFDAYKLYSNGATLIRKPYLIGHRGLPTAAPENTIESNKLALDAGADFIENDMYISKDGHLVIVHDSTLESTTNGTGKVEDYTLEQLKALNANKPHPEGYPDVRIPTFNEQVALARERNAMVMAEIKTSTPAAVEVYVSTIKEMDAEALIDSMSFDSNQLKRLAAQMPEMPMGLLVNSISSNETNPHKSLRDALKQVQGLNATFNVGYYGIGPKFLEAAHQRGMIVSPWTINNKADFMKLFAMGAFGLTTDYANWAADWAASIRAEKDQYALPAGGTTELAATIKSYKGEEIRVIPDIVLLDGENVVEATGNKLTGKKPGTAHALLRYTAFMEANNTYDIYTQPITLEVTGQEPGNPEPIPYTLSIEPSTFTMYVGGSQSITGVTYSSNADRQDVTRYAAYTPRDPAIVSVDNGVLKALHIGTTVIDVVYRNTAASAAVTVLSASSGSDRDRDSSTGGNAGGGAPAVQDKPTDKPADKILADNGKVDASTLRKAFEASSTAEVKFGGEKLELAAEGLLAASNKKDSLLVIAGDHAAYRLPLSVLKLEALAQQLGVSVTDMTVSVTIKKLSGGDAAAIEGAAAAAGVRQMADAMDFDIQASGKDGKTVSIPFDSTYVSREWVVNKALDVSKATAVWYSTATKRLRFVPSVFAVEGDQTKVTVKRNGNSAYTIVENDKRFADMANHWAQADVELLANKLVIDGVSNDKFDGDRTISRSEFAALLVRALGLSPSAQDVRFTDVAATDWYSQDVATAAAAGLIQGYEDGAFRPERAIHREELAAMMIRALSYAGVDTDLAGSKRDGALERFGDADKLTWAKDEVAKAVVMGFMDGVAEGKLSPDGSATRAQAAVMLKRLLSKAQFIN